MDALQGAISANQKPPSNKAQVSSQHSRTIESHNASQSSHHQQHANHPKSGQHEIGSGAHHKSQSYTRAQQPSGTGGGALSLKHHGSTNLLSANARHPQHQQTHLRQAELPLKVANTSGIAHKRGSDAAELDKKGASSFAKHSRMSQQISAAALGGTGHSTSTNRLLAHKSSISDFKKPASLSSNPISVNKNHSQATHQARASNHGGSTSATAASSKVVTGHSYQPHLLPTSGSQATIIKPHKSSSLIQTPTGGSMAGNHKPPLDSAKHSQLTSAGLQPSNTAASSSSNYHHRSGMGRGGSPRNQLQAFAKKQSHDAGILGKHHSHLGAPGISIADAKASFNHTSTNLKTISTFSPTEESSGMANKRGNDLAGHAVFPQSSKSSTSQQQLHQKSGSGTASGQLKAQLSRHSRPGAGKDGEHDLKRTAS